MKIWTTVNIPVPEFKIASGTQLLGVGSCFAERMLEFFSELKVGVKINPSGIIYNLDSMKMLSDFLAAGRYFTAADLFEYGDWVHSFYHHGSFSAHDAVTVLDKCNAELMDFRGKITVANDAVFFITPSSSVVYRHKNSRKIVANCHKLPNYEYDVEILSADDNLMRLKSMVNNLRSLNSSAKFILSVSPVRHYAGDLVLNSRSKANLISAVQEFCSQNQTDCYYFPSYEIVNDQLRDYRFYQPDLMHISEVAEKYLFELLCENCLTQEFVRKLEVAEKQQQFANHTKLKKE